MRKLLVVQHVPYEILGTLDPKLRDAGFRLRYLNFGRHPELQPSLDGYRGMIVLGGPMNVEESDRYPHLLTELRMIEDALERGIPILGICLGAQLIAHALGAHVGPNAEKEIGWYDVLPTEEASTDSLFTHFEPRERLFQWHGNTFEIPSGAVHLARSSSCANQAFRYGSDVYGLQFHLEVDEPLIDRWLSLPTMRTEIEQTNGRVCANRIREETPASIPRLASLSDRVFGEFIRLFGLPPKRRALPSR